MTMKSNDLGNILGGLLSGDMKEVKFEITCKLVEEEDPKDKTEENAISDESIPESEDEAFKVRPFLEEGRLNGIRQLAEFLSCAPSTAQKMKNNGEIPFYERGARVFFYKDEIAKALGPRSRYTKAGKEAACAR